MNTDFIKNIGIARNAIIEELEKRRKDGDTTVRFNERSQSEYDDDGDTNYVSGAGVMPCPVCKKGTLRYSRAAYNGHIHARCSTSVCVCWME